MNELIDLEEEIYKCSRCGLCQSVCPVYKATLNECAVSRGKFNLLNGIVKEELQLTPKIKKYLDLCTSCNACRDFCPSQIDAKEIFLAAKAKYHLDNKYSLKDKIFNSYFLFKLALITAKVFFHLYRLGQIDKVVKVLNPIIQKTGILGRRIFLLNTLIKKHKIENIKNKQQKTETAIFFEGCFNKYLNSESKEAVQKILAKTNIKLLKKDFECCGISYLNDGNIKAFKNIINKNLSQIDENYNFIITDCASCNAVLQKYHKYTNNNKAKTISKNTISVLDLIKKIKFKTKSKLKISIHKPCHETFNLTDFIKNINGINYTEVEDYDKCCGFSGKFALQYEEISRKISKDKAQKYINAGTDIILTTCPACMLGLNQGLLEIQTKTKPTVMNLFVFLAEFCSIDTTSDHA